MNIQFKMMHYVYKVGLLNNTLLRYEGKKVGRIIKAEFNKYGEGHCNSKNL